MLRLFLWRSSNLKLPATPSGELSLITKSLLLLKTSSKSSAGDTLSDTTLCSSDTVMACWCFIGGRGDKDFVVLSCFGGFESVNEFDFSNIFLVGGGENSSLVGLKSCFFWSFTDEGRSFGLSSRFWFFGESSTLCGLVGASVLVFISSFMLQLSQSSSFFFLSTLSLHLQFVCRDGDFLLFKWCGRLVSLE